MKHLNPYTIFILLLLCSSCNNAKLSPVEYVHYVENPGNGLLVSANVKGVSYTLQYQPTDYLVMLELKSFTIPVATFQEQYNRFKGMEHYVFHIDTKEIETLFSALKDTTKGENNLTEYLDFRAQKDIKMIEGDDTIPCAIAQCESSMGMLPYYSLVIGFPHRSYSGDREFLFDSKKIGTGEVKLLIKGRSIRNLPKLKMNG